jgi:mycothiol synthase
VSTLTSRAYTGTSDLHSAIVLLREQRAAAKSERYPTVRRLELLLTSRLWEPERAARFWVDEAGRVVACAALTSRGREMPGASLERVVQPAARDAKLDAALLDWALERARERADERGEPFTLSAVSFEDDPVFTDALERNGFRLQEGYNVYMARSLDAPLPEPAQPAGFTVRPLASEGELAAYDALYSFASMHPEHRRALLRDPGYLHLVAVAPDGTFVAFYECSIDRVEWARTGQRTGWVEYVGTLETHRRRGLGSAVLIAGLRWLREQGAQTAILVTMEGNSPARSLYDALGFRLVERDLIYGREVAAS